jgi:hypothetical protein
MRLTNPRPSLETKMTDPQKLNKLRSALHDLADEVKGFRGEADADVIREVADHSGMLERFAELLAFYDTPRDAVDAMYREAAKKLTPTAGTDLSGRFVGKHPALAMPYGGWPRATLPSHDR